MRGQGWARRRACATEGPGGGSQTGLVWDPEDGKLMGLGGSLTGPGHLASAGGLGKLSSLPKEIPPSSHKTASFPFPRRYNHVIVTQEPHAVCTCLSAHLMLGNNEVMCRFCWQPKSRAAYTPSPSATNAVPKPPACQKSLRSGAHALGPRLCAAVQGLEALWGRRAGSGLDGSAGFPGSHSELHT